MKTQLTVPAVVADAHLRLAGKRQLQVLLWFARHADETFDIHTCAAALGVDVNECMDAVGYWVDAGIFVQTGAAVLPQEVPLAASPVALDTVTAPLPIRPLRAHPAAVKPQLNEVEARQKNTPQFAELLNTFSARLGRPLSGGDMETVLYLYDTCGMPAEVLVMIVNWAVSKGKGNMRYIEKMAIDWSERGIDTIHAAEELLCTQERMQKAFEQVAQMLELSAVRPSVKQKETADRWLNEWHCSRALLREAYAVTMDKTGKFQMTYMDRILTGWYQDGITDPAQLKGETKSSKTASSLDTGGYEEMLVNFVPTYTKKE